MRLNIIGLAFILHKSVASLCDEKQCVQKCCPSGKYFLTNQCVLNSENKGFNDLSVYNDELKAVGVFGDFFGIATEGLPGEYFKTYVFLPHIVLYKNFHIIQNGDLVMENKKEPVQDKYTPDEYCIDYKLTPNESMSKDLTIWFKRRVEATKVGNHVILKWGFLISSVFLVLVLVVYSLLPELRNLGGLILMAYVASLLMGFIFMFSMQVASNRFQVATCLSITSLAYFFLLASFCWLNVMSYDIWWTFRGYAKARPIHRQGEKIKFIIYCLYGFGTPLAMTIALVTLNEVNARHKLSGIVPDIPNKGCFIEGLAKFMYFYVPMLLMILANWVFFLMTTFNIWRLSRGNDVLRTADSSTTGSKSARNNNKQRFIMYIKLSVLMGLNWILEVVSSFYPYFSGWYITDCYNVFFGVIIFIFFVCKRKILNKLKKRVTTLKHQHKFSLQSKSRSRSSQDESNTQSIPLQSPNCSTATTK